MGRAAAQPDKYKLCVRGKQHGRTAVAELPRGLVAAEPHHGAAVKYSGRSVEIRQADTLGENGNLILRYTTGAQLSFLAFVLDDTDIRKRK